MLVRHFIRSIGEAGQLPGSRRPYSFANKVWTMALLLTAMAGLTACGSMPPLDASPPTQALDAPSDGMLARAVHFVGSNESPQAAPNPDTSLTSGFRLLPAGGAALDARLAMANRAERSLDVQYYFIKNDQSGVALLRALRDAAVRGVRVRLLVDDYYSEDLADLLSGLETYPGVEVKVFNPLSMRSAWPPLRLLLSKGSLETKGRRMHNKLLIADNTFAILGGRNIADEYFMENPSENFVDLDVLGAGRVAVDLSAAFDTYWNSTWSRRLQDLNGRASDTIDQTTRRSRFEQRIGVSSPRSLDAMDPLGQQPVETALAKSRLELLPGSARVFADPPDKVANRDPRGSPTEAMRGLLDAIAKARHEVVIVSPYFLPGPLGMGMMQEARRHGVRVVIITNSLASSDVPLVYERYRNYRLAMLKMGVELYEFGVQLTRRASGFGRFGASIPRLHAKGAMIDQSVLAVGSVNLDPRSANENTEMSVAIECPALAHEFNQLVSGVQLRSMYKLHLADDDHSIEWEYTDTYGTSHVTRDEPDAPWWILMRLKFESSFVSEGQL